MTCKDFENEIHEVVNRRETYARQAEALEHASRCLYCAMRLDEEARLVKELQGLRKTLRAYEAPIHVEEALIRTLRVKASREAANQDLAWPWLRMALGCGIALVVMGMVALLALVLTSEDRHSNEPSSQAAISTPHPSPTPSSGKAVQPPAGPAARQNLGQKTLESLGQRPKSSRAALRHRDSRPQAVREGGPPKVALETPVPELTTDWISLGACDDAECADEAVLVRMTLSSETLLMFGIPVDSDFASGTVLADVVLGSDGVPYAIRFVD